VNRSLLFGVPLAALLLASGSTRADPIAWSYNWTPTISTVLADSPGTGKILLSNQAAAAAVNSSDIVATNIRTASTAPFSSPDRFTNAAYGLALILTDKASGASGTVTFTGVFNGTLTALSANITNSFTGPQTQVLQLGANTYTVTMGSYTPPPPPGAFNAGAISAYARVSVQATGAGGGPQAPEPSTLALAGLGLSLSGGALWRGRRNSSCTTASSATSVKRIGGRGEAG
jgi:hypothetical protein